MKGCRCARHGRDSSRFLKWSAIQPQFLFESFSAVSPVFKFPSDGCFDKSVRWLWTCRTDNVLYSRTYSTITIRSVILFENFKQLFLVPSAGDENWKDWTWLTLIGHVRDKRLLWCDRDNHYTTEGRLLGHTFLMDGLEFVGVVIVCFQIENQCCASPR